MEKIIGLNAVREALDGSKNIEKIEIYKGTNKDRIRDILSKASKKNIKIFYTDKRQENSQGIAALVSEYDYYLELNEKETASIYQNDGALLISEKKAYLENESIINLGEHVFDNDAIIFRGLNSNEVTIKCKKNSRELKVKYDNFPYIAFWSVPKAPFVCIEPWYGQSDFTDASGELTEKEGIEKVKDRFTAKLSISLKV